VHQITYTFNVLQFKENAMQGRSLDSSKNKERKWLKIAICQLEMVFLRTFTLNKLNIWNGLAYLPNWTNPFTSQSSILFGLHISCLGHTHYLTWGPYAVCYVHVIAQYSIWTHIQVFLNSKFYHFILKCWSRWCFRLSFSTLLSLSRYWIYNVYFYNNEWK
jgi:hypothetical protein